jgi:beta-mannosidase
MDMMGRLAYELDGSRVFHRTSPLGGSLHNYATYWEMKDMDVTINLSSHFLAEFGMASAPNMESVKRYLPEAEQDIWPPERFGSFGHHTPRFNQLEPCDMEHLMKRVPEFCDGSTMSSFIWGSQMAQATLIRHTVEANRVRWPESAGICYYKLTDVYPACSWSTIDYYGVPKLSHYVVKNSFAHVHACMIFKSLKITEDTHIPVYLLDDAGDLSQKSWQVELTLYREDLSIINTKSYQGKTADRVNYLGELLITETSIGSGPLLIIINTYADGVKKDSTTYWLNYQHKQNILRKLPKSTLSITAKDQIVIIKNTGANPVFGIEITCPAQDTTFVTEDSMISLKPGDTASLSVSSTTGIKVEAWNAEVTYE